MALCLEDVFAPVFVGRPPTDAFIGLAKLPNGDIRYYNYGLDASLPPPDEEGRFYIESKDSGLTWARRVLPDWQAWAADQRSPISGDYIRLYRSASCSRWGLPCPNSGCIRYNGYKKSGDVQNEADSQANDCRGLLVIRRHGNIDGPLSLSNVIAGTADCSDPKPPLFIRNGQRILVGATVTKKIALDGALFVRGMVGVLYSDDDGHTWSVSARLSLPLLEPYRHPRLNHGPWEPTMVELADGRIWMLMRTGHDNHYESFSSDGGETWSALQPSRFYAMRTMPTIGRLQDGRLLLVWCNTTPLPASAGSEGPPPLGADGQTRDCFTNRDAAHAAISDDDGKTWRGFRELILDPRRSAGDYAETGGHDRGVHQSQFVEVGENKILVALGQHRLHRSLLIFDLDWLYERERASDFSNGLEDWSVQSYIAGVRGHCALNRKQGAKLVDHPDMTGKKALRIARPSDPTLVSEKQGAVWNFPAGANGSLTLRLMLPEGGQGTIISLVDRWINPTDDTIEQYAMFSVEIAGELTAGNAWRDVRLEWNGLDRKDEDACALFIDEVPHTPLRLLRPSVNGICYVHLISSAKTEDDSGLLLQSARAETGDDKRR